VDGGDAVRQHRRHHQVLGTGDGRHVEMDGGAFQPVGPRDELAALELDLRAHQPEPDEMLLHTPHADVVPTWLGDASLAAARQERPHQQKGGTHSAGQRGQHVRADEPGGVHPQLLPIGIRPVDLGADALE